MTAAAETLIHSVSLIDGDHTDGAWIAFAHGRVSARGTGDDWLTVAAQNVIDGEGAFVTPGFIDIHCHGALGVGFEMPDADGDAVDRALALHTTHGTTRSVLSLVSADVPTLAHRIEALRPIAETHPGVLGLHLEGPFLDPAHRGAHDPLAITTASSVDVERLIGAGAGAIRQVTLAPERSGAMDAIARFTDAGIAVAVGHTGTDYAGARAAFDAGASILTHACNAMEPIHHRAPGPVVAAIDAGVTLELIADGVHVHPSVISMLAQAAPQRIALISDAMAATGAGDGWYVLGSMTVEVRRGVARLLDGDSIAGSTLTLDLALRTAVDDAEMSLVDAVEALTVVPARAIGRDDLGTLAVGAVADAVLWNDSLTAPTSVWRDGVLV